MEAHGGIQKERNLQRPVGDMEHACLCTGACGRHGTCLPTYRGLWETWNMLAYVQGPLGDMEHACLRTESCGRHGTCLPTYRGLWETWNMLAYVQGPVGDMEHACLRTGAWNQHLEECETLLQFNNLNLRYVSLPVFSSIFSLSAQQTRMLLPDWQQRTVNTMGPTADAGDDKKV